MSKLIIRARSSHSKGGANRRFFPLRGSRRGLRARMHGPGRTQSDAPAEAVPRVGRETMDLRTLVASLRASWWLPLIGLLLGGAAAAAYCLAQTPLYTSSTQLFVSTNGTSSTTDVFQGSQFSQQRVASYARLIAGEDLAQRVAQRLSSGVSARAISGEIDPKVVANTVLIDVDVTDASPERAQEIAQAVGTEFSAQVTELERPTDGGASPVRVVVTDRPEVPQTPSSPSIARNIAFGLLVGLIAGVGASIARTRLDRSVKDPVEAAALAQAPVIGTVLRDDTLQKWHTIDRAASSRTAEDYRQLRTNLQFLRVDDPPRVIMVSSALPSEGKTTMAINLALGLAEAGKTVVLIEADLRRPRVTKYLGMVSGVGLTNVLAGTAGFDEVVQTYGSTSVSVLAAGPTPPNPGELLASSHMSSLLEKLRASYDFLIIDAPPLLPVADASGLAGAVDGVLLSVRYGTTRKEELQQAAVTLERVRATTLGIVLNIVPPKADVAVASGYGYTYYAEKHAVGKRSSLRRSRGTGEGLPESLR